jgi:hypothetical protein
MDWQQQETEVQRAGTRQRRGAREDVQVRVMPASADPSAASPSDYRLHMLLSALMLVIALALASMQ